MPLQCTSQTPQEQHASPPAPLPIEAEVLRATRFRAAAASVEGFPGPEGSIGAELN
jgi:hypothetical protein